MIEKTQTGSNAALPEPVCVVESIPIAREDILSPEMARREHIPIPHHLSIFAELGHGAMGHVHPARDRNLLRFVAMKRLTAEIAAHPFYRDGFIAEAQMTGQLEHPNIVPVHELSIGEGGIPYFTMKLVQGEGFHRWLARRPIGNPERMEGGLEIFLKICDAVGYAHHRGVIHRDLKPENIMVGTFGQVYVMDWGLARLTRTAPAAGDKAQMNAPGAVGTPEYMAPEQARGNPRDMTERSDIFGLGSMLYEIVSGKIPYGMNLDQDDTLARARAGQIVSIDEACAHIGVSKRIRSIIQRATEPDPMRRYATAAELQKDVKGFLQGGLHLPRRAFSEGSLIVREGDAGDAAFMIVAGRCRAFRTVDGREETLSVMEPGDVFGEMALLLEEPRAASVVAMDTVTVLVLDKATMTEGLGLDGWTGALVRALAQRFKALEQTVRNSGIRRG